MNENPWKNGASILHYGLESQTNIAELNKTVTEILSHRSYDGIIACFKELLALSEMTDPEQLVTKEKMLEQKQEELTRYRIELIKEGTLLRQLRLTNDTYAEVVRNEIEEARNYYNHGGETDPNKEDFRFRKDMIGKRIQELTTSQKVAESFSPQIRISEDNCFKMADRIWDTLVSVMPLLRSKIAMENSKTILSQTRKMIRDALNDMEKPF